MKNNPSLRTEEENEIIQGFRRENDQLKARVLELEEQNEDTQGRLNIACEEASRRLEDFNTQIERTERAEASLKEGHDRIQSLQVTCGDLTDKLTMAVEALELIHDTPPITQTEIRINKCVFEALASIKKRQEEV